MEVREIVETIVREPVLEVRFRLDSDSDDVIRISEFIISEIQDYGYNVLYEEFDLFDYDEDEDDDKDFILLHPSANTSVFIGIISSKASLEQDLDFLYVCC